MADRRMLLIEFETFFCRTGGEPPIIAIANGRRAEIRPNMENIIFNALAAGYRVALLAIKSKSLTGNEYDMGIFNEAVATVNQWIALQPLNIVGVLSIQNLDDLPGLIDGEESLIYLTRRDQNLLTITNQAFRRVYGSTIQIPDPQPLLPRKIITLDFASAAGINSMITHKMATIYNLIEGNPVSLVFCVCGPPTPALTALTTYITELYQHELRLRRLHNVTANNYTRQNMRRIMLRNRDDIIVLPGPSTLTLEGRTNALGDINEDRNIGGVDRIVVFCFLRDMYAASGGYTTTVPERKERLVREADQFQPPTVDEGVVIDFTF